MVFIGIIQSQEHEEVITEVCVPLKHHRQRHYIPNQLLWVVPSLPMQVFSTHISKTVVALYLSLVTIVTC